MYEAMAQAYLKDGQRSARHVSRVCQIPLDTCRKAINDGWPERRWASLRERAKLHDRQVAEREANQRNVLSPEQVVSAERFFRLREENLQLARALRGLLAQMLQKIGPAIERAVADRHGQRTRVIDVQRGKRVVQQVVKEDAAFPPYLPHLAQALRDLVGVSEIAGKAERTWAGAEAPEGSAPVSMGWEELTPDQLRYIRENEGRLPEGVTIDQLRQRK
jgi:hypothetical protein